MYHTVSANIVKATETGVWPNEGKRRPGDSYAARPHCRASPLLGGQ